MTVSTPTTAGQILTSAYVNNNINSGLVYIKQQTIGSGVTSVPVTSAFSAEFDNYRIVVSKVVVSASGNSSFITLSGSAGATYFTNGWFMAPSSGTVNGFNSNGVTTGVWLGITGNTTSIAFDVMSPFLAAATNVVGSSSGSGNSFNNNFAGSDSNAASSTGFTLTQATSNWTGGTITVYGYRKA
jgi:hypothetical protein